MRLAALTCPQAPTHLDFLDPELDPVVEAAHVIVLGLAEEHVLKAARVIPLLAPADKHGKHSGLKACNLTPF
jgi:hypothetical protein